MIVVTLSLGICFNSIAQCLLALKSATQQEPNKVVLQPAINNFFLLTQLHRLFNFVHFQVTACRAAHL